MRETAIFLLPAKKSDVTVVFSDPDFSYDEGILAIWPQVRAILHIFFIAHARNGQISTFDQKSDVIIVFADPDFL